MFEDFDSAAFQLTEAEFKDRDEEYNWVDKLATILEAIMAWIQPAVTPSNFEELISSLLGKVTYFTKAFWSPHQDLHCL